MTANRSFKQRVRERMARTGERYTTARTHLLAQHAQEPVAGLLPGWVRTGGVQPDLAATANALAHVGATGPTAAPLDEVDVLGLSGGIGFMYAVFEWQGYGPTLTLTTRVDPMPDLSVAAALSRAGVTHEVLETTGPATARRHLDRALASGRPALVSVDESGLAHRGGDGAPAGGTPRVVGLVGQRGDTLLLDDQDPAPVEVTTDGLVAARAALRGRNRLVLVGEPDAEHDPRAATRAALRRTVDGYDSPPARPFASNVGTAGLDKWARLLTATDRRSWARVFDRPAHLAHAYARTRGCVNEDLTAPGAGRGLWATYLDRCAQALGEPALAGIADAARASEQRWIEVADVADRADPDRDPGPVFATLAGLVSDIAARERALLDDLAGTLAA